ncbi:hypothetical protein ACS0TY_034840 [Phlomoides rotata]
MIKITSLPMTTTTNANAVTASSEQVVQPQIRGYGLKGNLNGSVAIPQEYVAVANKIIIPVIAALKFPTLEVNYPEGSSCEVYEYLFLNHFPLLAYSGKLTAAQMAGISQDWEPVVIRKTAPTAAARKDEKAVNAARRSGAEIETVKKSLAGINKAASSSTSLNTRKLDEDTENLTHDKDPTELKKAIMQARMDKKLTQAQVAQLINEKPR